MEDLPQLHQLFPRATEIHLTFDGNLINENYFSKFEQLEEIIFETNYFMNNFSLEPFTEFLKNFNNNKKLRKIIFPTFEMTDEEEVLNFYNILFEKTNLVEFKRINSFLTMNESKVIASWIQNNSTLQKISLACEKF
jgi:hypothetical protein